MSDDIRVEFAMWGQGCCTYFSEEDAAFNWLWEMYNKGWLDPREILKGEVVLYSKEEILYRINK